jgi:hypothetical protein
MESIDSQDGMLDQSKLNLDKPHSEPRPASHLTTDEPSRIDGPAVSEQKTCKEMSQSLISEMCRFRSLAEYAPIGLALENSIT